MKGHSTATNATAKRRLTFRSIVIPAIALLSLFYTVFVLRGLHDGYREEEDVNMVGGFDVNVRFGGGGHLENKEEKKPSLPKEVPNITVGKDDSNIPKADKNFTVNIGDSTSLKDTSPQSETGKFIFEGSSKSDGASLETPSVSSSKDDGKNKKRKPKFPQAAALKSCQIEHGSYCLWSAEHRGVMNDTVVKRMKDQLYVARAYYPTIAKLKGKEKLSQEMKLSIQEYEHIFVEAASDSELPPFVSTKIEKMDQTIGKAKSCTVDCSNVDKKFRQLLDLTEDEAHFHRKQSAFLHRLGVQTKPKSHHCLSMRLTVEYFIDSPRDIDTHKSDNPSYQQYVIISTNVLAVSVVINSTVMNSKDSGDMVFNVVTDKQYFFAMKMWFSRNRYKEAVVQVLNIEDVDLAQSKLSPSEEFRVSIDGTSSMKTEYISLFGHSHFLLPDIFKKSKKVILLDDDIVVQRDLSSLWDFDLDGKVNGAVKFCGVRLKQLKSYLGKNEVGGDGCAWMSGLNIIDLDKWRELNITRKYQQLVPPMMKSEKEEASWRASVLAASLVAFEDQIRALDESLVVSGLGYDYKISRNAVKKAGVLHYNGDMKPWIDLGIPRYKSFWRRYLTQEEPFMDQCNLNR